MGLKCSKPTDSLEIRTPQLLMSNSQHEVSVRQALTNNKLLSAFFKTKNLSYEVVSSMVKAMILVDLRKEDVLHRAGEEANCLYVVIEGGLRIVCDGVTIGKVDKNECAGEIGFINRCKATASLIAARGSKLYKLDFSTFSKFSESSCLVENITQIPMLARLSVSDAEAMMRMVDVRKYSAGECIVHKDSAPDCWYVIASGHAAVDCGLDYCGRPIKVGGLIGPNCYFGEESLLKDHNQLYNITAYHDMACYVFSKEAFNCPHMRPVKTVLAENQSAADSRNPTRPRSANKMKKRVSFCDDIEIQFV